MIEDIYVITIIVGLTSLLVILYYNRLLKNLLDVLSNLLRLQDTRNNDVEQYIQTIADNLKNIGVKNIFYDISYLNKHISSSNKKFESAIVLKKAIYYKNIDGYLLIEVVSNNGEYKVINKLILFVITLQIVNAIHTDIEKINESFARIAKLQTYMMHDLKNILQFFQAMQYNVANIQTQQQQAKFIDFLQNSTEPINKKVNKILSLLQIESRVQTTTQKTDINLLLLLKEYKEQYKLNCTISGNAQLYIDEEAFRTVIENILSNIHYKVGNNPQLQCTINITDIEEIVTLVIQDNGEIFIDPNNVSQPFYTTKEDGLGIGMYQAKTLTELLNGSLRCENKEGKATVTIQLPKV